MASEISSLIENSESSSLAYGGVSLSSSSSIITTPATSRSPQQTNALDDDPPNNTEEEEEEESNDNSNNNNNNPPNTTTSTNNDFLTRTRQRLRCLFIMFTCPIIPLATALAIILVYLVYLALFNDEASQCHEPLRSYAFLSALLFLYTPHHNRIKRLLARFYNSQQSSSNLREEAYNRSIHRIYDHLYLTFCLAYIYIGVEWTENCRSASSICLDEVEGCPRDCNCPALFKITRAYVLILCALATVLALPLLCLPCVYYWIVRGAEADAIQTASDITNHLNNAPNHNLTPAQVERILDQMQPLQTVPTSCKECCICMVEFNLSQDKILKTNCNHIFHRECMKSWLNNSSGKKCCPLCRADLLRQDDDDNDNEVQEIIPILEDDDDDDHVV